MKLSSALFGIVCAAYVLPGVSAEPASVADASQGQSIATKVCAGTDPDAFFFSSDGHVGNLFVFVEQINELQHVDVGNARYQIDSGVL